MSEEENEHVPNANPKLELLFQVDEESSAICFDIKHVSNLNVWQASIKRLLQEIFYRKKLQSNIKIELKIPNGYELKLKKIDRSAK